MYFSSQWTGHCTFLEVMTQSLDHVTSCGCVQGSARLLQCACVGHLIPGSCHFFSCGGTQGRHQWFKSVFCRELSRYDRDSAFPEKKEYRPNVRIEYVDDDGRQLTTKEVRVSLGQAQAGPTQIRSASVHNTMHSTSLHIHVLLYNTKHSTSPQIQKCYMYTSIQQVLHHRYRNVILAYNKYFTTDTEMVTSIQHKHSTSPQIQLAYNT